MNQPTQNPMPDYSQPPTAKRLVRRRDDKMVAGVCSGVAENQRMGCLDVR